MKRFFGKAISVFLLVGVFLFNQVLLAQAATIFPSPNSGSYNIGKSFSVGVFVSSADQAINAVSGTLSFPKDKLEVTSVSKSGSVVSLWVQDPSFSNSAGTVSFEGIVLNPGFTGASGRIITVNFRAKNGGAAPITFSAGSVLANDGQGTNILSGLGSARYDIEVPVSGPAAPEAETPSAIIGTPPAPLVSSQTHEDPDRWYNNNQPQFSWSLPEGITAVKLLADNKPQSDPSVVYAQPISSRNLDQLEDGIWYFHIQLQNSVGWGGIAHFRFQIDTKNPEYFNISEVARQDLTEPFAKFIFEAADEVSGIDHYEIQIDNNEAIVWQDDGTGIYQTPVLAPGKHRMMVKVFDGAGNSIANFAEFEITALTLPTINNFTKDLTSSERFRATGSSYPNAQVIFELNKSGEETVTLTANTDEQGNFDLISEDPLVDGKYKLRVKVVDSRGAQSFWTEDFEVRVQKPALWRFGSVAISVLSVIIPLFALITLLAFMLWYSWHKFRSFRRRVSREVSEAEVVLQNAFANLKVSVANRVKMLEKTGQKRDLTPEEARMVMQLRKDLDRAESIVAKEIRDIQKEVK